MDIHLTPLAGTTQSGTSADSTTRPPEPQAGLIVLWTGQRPQFRIIELTRNIPLLTGREDLGGHPLPDDQVSRQHGQIVFDGQKFQVTDNNSRNGTFINGHRISGTVACGPNALIRIGRTIMRTYADVRPLQGATVSTEQNFVVGPSLRSALDRLQRFATGGANVLLTGENGTGKDRAAQAFHKAATPRGPFISVNCGTLTQASAAVSQLFGSGKDKYTGVKGGPGLVEAADGGTLFLDEVGDLPMEVQVMLLRAIENGEALRSGENEARKVSVRWVSATNRDVKQQVESGTFRRDLYHRLAHVEVHLPPLRERVEEIPYLVQIEVEAAGRVPHHELVEAALLRPWPGNVRDLIKSVLGARLHAKHETLVRREDLEASSEAPPRALNQTAATIAYSDLEDPRKASLAGPVPATSPSIPAYDGGKPDNKQRNPGREKLLELEAKHGSWSEVARVLGEQRTTVTRWREECGLKKKGVANTDPRDSDDDDSDDPGDKN